jgi:hypothetical protein
MLPLLSQSLDTSESSVIFILLQNVRRHKNISENHRVRVPTPYAINFLESGFIVIRENLKASFFLANFPEIQLVERSRNPVG